MKPIVLTPGIVKRCCRAREALDRTVFAAYGWEYPLAEEEILRRLLALNLERAG